jgi:hypothetical protein
VINLEQLKEKVYCKTCKGKRIHNILSTYDGTDRMADIQHKDLFHVVSCAGCETIAFVNQYGDEDMWDTDVSGHRYWYDKFWVYPEEPPLQEVKFYELSSKQFINVPESIKSLYEQIIHVHNQGFLLLSTVGIRTLIEAICLDVGIKEGNLFEDKDNIKVSKKGENTVSTSLEGKIYGLYQQGMIIWEQTLILQKIRDIGNAAVHEIRTPKINVFMSAVGIIEQVLTNVYDLKVHKLLK